MKNKLKNAPYLAEQRKDGAELLILIGSQAWQAWGQGNATEWQLLAQAIQTDPTQKPVILGGTQLAEIDLLQLAEAEDRTAVRLFQFGAFTKIRGFIGLVKTNPRTRGRQRGGISGTKSKEKRPYD